MLADRGYDADALIHWLEQAHTEVVITVKKNRLVERQINQHLYKDRNKVERYFNELKQYRRVATPYEKTVVNFAGFVDLASALILLA